MERRVIAENEENMSTNNFIVVKNNFAFDKPFFYD